MKITNALFVPFAERRSPDLQFKSQILSRYCCGCCCWGAATPSLILGLFGSTPAPGAAGPLPPGFEAFVTSFRGGRLPLMFCGGRFAVIADAGFLGSTFGRVNGRYDEVL